jgi:formylglycine-generating enzyme required for sulfatase activity
VTEFSGVPAYNPYLERASRVASTAAPLPAALREAQERLEEARASDQPIRTFRDALNDGSQGPEMAVLPEGRFAMGSPPGEKGSFRDEGPQHTVTIARAFALGRYEVTVAEFRRFISDTDYQTDAERGEGCHVWTGDRWALKSGMGWQTPGFAQAGTHPVLCVSWNDAVAYTKWLSRQTGKRYRLPSEAEWEYGARAGSSTARHWGNDSDDACGYANVADRTVRERFSGFTVHDCTDGYVRTAPVGTFKPNPVGLYDMLGNVWEWTTDCWNVGYAGAPTDGSAWSSDNCSRRVLRGGSWGTKPSYVRSASRYGLAADDREDFVGFRVARDL